MISHNQLLHLLLLFIGVINQALFCCILLYCFFSVCVKNVQLNYHHSIYYFYYLFFFSFFFYNSKFFSPLHASSYYFYNLISCLHSLYLLFPHFFYPNFHYCSPLPPPNHHYCDTTYTLLFTSQLLKKKTLF